jgi:RHS repeat-associated protein
MVRAENVTITLLYTYTADGLRVAQAIDGVETTYAWDWASGLPEMLSDGASLYLVGHDTLGRFADGEWTYHLPDALGSVRQVADGAGSLASSREWTPFGVEVGAAQAGLGYTGEWNDPNVGLTYLRARWYAPSAGRFTQADPLRLEQNSYLYAGANPVNWADPSGWYRALVVRGANADHPDGLAVRSFPHVLDNNGPMFKTNILRRIPDGTKVIAHPNFPSPGTDGNINRKWYHLFSINGEYVWNVFGPWAASDYLVDDSGPSALPNPGPSPSSSDWVLPLDTPIQYWNGYGYYNWATNTDGTCSPCESYQQPELEYPGYGCNLCFHNGWDMTTSSSNDVYAMGDGEVVAGSSANRLHVSHTVNGVNIEIQYTHVNHPGIDVGAEVKAGQKLGLWGPYGTKWPHFHWTVKVGGQVVNPKDYWPGNIPTSFTGTWGNPIVVP